VEGDEDLLDQVVALGDGADEPRDPRSHRVRVPVEEARERGAVALAGRGDQRAIVRFPARAAGSRPAMEPGAREFSQRQTCLEHHAYIRRHRRS
jgi:hypothetical protein